MCVGEHIFTFHHNHHMTKNQTGRSRACNESVIHHTMKKDHDHKMNIPKGYVKVMVGHVDEEQQRFIIPLMHMNHPLFAELLKEAEKEYGFKHDGPISIPCRVQEFRKVQGMIDQDYHHIYRRHHHHQQHCLHIC